MKQIITLIKDLVRPSRVSTLNRNGKKFSKVLFVLGLAAFATINSGFISNGSASRAEKVSYLKKTVPFKGTLSVFLGENETAGTGVATHLGKFDYFSVDDASNFPYLTGTATLTAANGDQIFTTFSGTLQDLGNGMLGISFDNIITGGTGRFDDATGSFTSSGTANTTTFTANTTFTGEISY